MKHSNSSKIQKTLHTLWLFAVAIQALWMLVLYSGWVVNSGALDRYLDFIGVSRDVSTTQYELPSVIARPLEVLVVIAVIIIIILIMSRTPKTAAQVTVRATAEATKSVEPVVRHVLPKRSIKRNNWYVTLFSRMLVGSIIFVLTLPVHFVTEGISTQVIWTITTSLWVASSAVLSYLLIVHHMSRSR